MVAALQPKVKKLVNYVRGKTWLPPPLGNTTVARLLGREPGGEANRESGWPSSASVRRRSLPVLDSYLHAGRNRTLQKRARFLLELQVHARAGVHCMCLAPSALTVIMTHRISISTERILVESARLGPEQTYGRGVPAEHGAGTCEEALDCGAPYVPRTPHEHLFVACADFRCSSFSHDASDP